MTADDRPLILWFRRDLRLGDNPMLAAAADSGRPVVPVFVLDPDTEALGAAHRMRLGQGLAVLARALAAIGSRLTFRRGPALESLRVLAAETGAGAVHWGRLYDPATVARDTAVKAALHEGGLEAESHPGHLLREPWSVATGQGGFYRVFTPYWRAIRGLGVPDPAPAPGALRPPAAWPASDRLEDWRLDAAMNRGAGIVAPRQRVGEAEARARVRGFLDAAVEAYVRGRDRPAEDGTSRLSQNLALGEIGVREVWHAAAQAMDRGAAGAETFLKELGWREFAYHLMHHTPHIVTDHWRREFDRFPWRGDNEDAERWRRGMTGEPFVDAAIREMYVTGTMHNRARMIAASYLTKHLLTDWRVGQRHFADCLTDWDPASNAMGWQWAAGSGPDASPFFRVFNPETQAERFDADGRYRRRFVAELAGTPGRDALDFFAAVPRSWGLRADQPYPAPVVGLAEGRDRALRAFGARNA